MEAEQAKAVVRAYFQRLLNERDLSACDQLLAPDCVDHDSPAGTPPGPDGIKEFVSQFLSDYPNLHVWIEDMIVEGGKVAIRNIWRGTHKDGGAQYHVTGISIIRLNPAGQLAERWSAYAPVE
ncbi:MAG: ester cyclase [Symbiobacteriia bacterium]